MTNIMSKILCVTDCKEINESSYLMNLQSSKKLDMNKPLEHNHKIILFMTKNAQNAIKIIKQMSTEMHHSDKTQYILIYFSALDEIVDELVTHMCGRNRKLYKYNQIKYDTICKIINEPKKIQYYDNFTILAFNKAIFDEIIVDISDNIVRQIMDSHIDICDLIKTLREDYSLIATIYTTIEPKMISDNSFSIKYADKMFQKYMSDTMFLVNKSNERNSMLTPKKLPQPIELLLPQFGSCDLNGDYIQTKLNELISINDINSIRKIVSIITQN